MVKIKRKLNRNRNFVRKLAVLEDSKNAIQNRLEIQSLKLSIREQDAGDIEKYGDKNPFVFKDIDQQDNDLNLIEFLDLAENNKINYDRIPIFDDILDSQRDIHLFILNGECIKNDGECLLSLLILQGLLSIKYID